MAELNDSDIEKLLQTYYPKIRKDTIGKPQGPCLSLKTIAAFFDDALTAEEHQAFASHITSCDACAELFKEHLGMVKTIETEPEVEVPPEVMERAQELFRKAIRENFLTIILKVTDQALKLLETTGDILIGKRLIPLPVLRSQSKEEPSSPVTIVKDFKQVSVQVTIEKELRAGACISVKVAEKAHPKKEPDFRVTLVKDTRELHSLLTERNQATFEEVSPGRYEIVIGEEANILARIRLVVES